MSDNKTSAGKGMGVAALVLGILGVVCSFIPCFGIFAICFGVLAIIFGAIGLSQAKKGNGSQGMPRAGLILGIISFAFAILYWVLVVAAVAEGAAEVNDALNELNNAIDAYE